MIDQSKNYYEVLEVNSLANFDEIHTAYQKAKNAYTGDSIALYSLMSEDEAQKVLNLIEEAYSILSDPVKRKSYNEVRGIESSSSADSSTAQEAKASSDQRIETATREHSKVSAGMNKLVAKNKYGLEFEINSEIEKEIEQCTEFTGEFLKKIREYKQVDIPRLAEMTKISKTYIRYIEDEEVAKMPAVAYVRGFIYQYAKCIKLNPELVANSYIHRMKKLKGE